MFFAYYTGSLHSSPFSGTLRVLMAVAQNLKSANAATDDEGYIFVPSDLSVIKEI